MHLQSVKKTLHKKIKKITRTAVTLANLPLSLLFNHDPPTCSSFSESLSSLTLLSFLRARFFLTSAKKLVHFLLDPLLLALLLLALAALASFSLAEPDSTTMLAIVGVLVKIVMMGVWLELLLVVVLVCEALPPSRAASRMSFSRRLAIRRVMRLGDSRERSEAVVEEFEVRVEPRKQRISW